MTTSSKSVKYSPPVEIDPNFFLPPNVVDMRYVDIGKEADSPTARDDQGEIVNIDYDEISYSEMDSDPEIESGNDSTPQTLFPPTYMTVVSQTVRVTADGKFVVDVVLDVEDIPGVVQYDVRITKT